MANENNIITVSFKVKRGEVKPMKIHSTIDNDKLNGFDTIDTNTFISEIMDGLKPINLNECKQTKKNLKTWIDNIKHKIIDPGEDKKVNHFTIRIVIDSDTTIHYQNINKIDYTNVSTAIITYVKYNHNKILAI